jgi:hypothetical protein
MMHDPFQTLSALGAYPGQNPFQSPYAQHNPVAFNPYAAAYPPSVGGIPPQLLAQILAARAAVPQFQPQSPWSSGLNNPLLAAAVLQNPLIAGGLENQLQLMNPIFAQSQFGPQQPYPFNPYIGQGVPQFGQMGSPYGQIGSPYGQTGSPFGQIGSPYGQLGPMLAPQSWVGQPGYGSHAGQLHPFVAQLAGRGFQAGVFPGSL